LFEDEVASLKNAFEHGCYKYANPSETFRVCTTSHFHTLRQSERYGVYIVRQLNTRKVLYIGKGGTINTKGKFKGQDIPGRLKNRQDGVSRNKWFGKLLEDNGPLTIEYIFLSKSKSPAFIEAVLLQAYLNEHKHLPCRNKGF
jgi:hypothetical protein